MFCMSNSWELFAQIIFSEAHTIALCCNNWLCPCVDVNCNMKHKDFISSLGGGGRGGLLQNPCNVHGSMYLNVFV